MITLRNIEFELDDPKSVIQNLKWAVNIKSETATWFNWTWNDRPKRAGNFNSEHSTFILNPILKYWITCKPSLVLIQGTLKNNKTISINLELSFAGMLALIFNIVFIGFLYIIPTDEPGAQSFVLLMGLALILNFFQFYRDLNKTDKQITNMIDTAEERSNCSLRLKTGLAKQRI